MSWSGRETYSVEGGRHYWRMITTGSMVWVRDARDGETASQLVEHTYSSENEALDRILVMIEDLNGWGGADTKFWGDEAPVSGEESETLFETTWATRETRCLKNPRSWVILDDLELESQVFTGSRFLRDGILAMPHAADVGRDLYVVGISSEDRLGRWPAGRLGLIRDGDEKVLAEALALWREEGGDNAEYGCSVMDAARRHEFAG